MYIVFSAALPGRTALRLKFQRGAGQSAAASAVLCRELQNNSQSTASQLPSGTPPPHLARCSQVCRKDGPEEAREVREQRHGQLQEDHAQDPGRVQLV